MIFFSFSCPCWRSKSQNFSLIVFMLLMNDFLFRILNGGWLSVERFVNLTGSFVCLFISRLGFAQTTLDRHPQLVVDPFHRVVDFKITRVYRAKRNSRFIYLALAARRVNLKESAQSSATQECWRIEGTCPSRFRAMRQKANWCAA